LTAILWLPANRELGIASLVVHPDHFKKGLATQLLNFALQKYVQPVVLVETAVANAPAIFLYKKFGFQKVDTYVADLNIEKIRLVLNR
jgi:ribosomal protein S18 acetylase RimI-like enzyme